MKVNDKPLFVCLGLLPLVTSYCVIQYRLESEFRSQMIYFADLVASDRKIKEGMYSDEVVKIVDYGADETLQRPNGFVLTGIPSLHRGLLTTTLYGNGLQQSYMMVIVFDENGRVTSKDSCYP